MIGMGPGIRVYLMAFLTGSAVAILGTIYVHWTMPLVPVFMGIFLLARAAELRNEGNFEMASTVRVASIIFMSSPGLMLLAASFFVLYRAT